MALGDSSGIPASEWSRIEERISAFEAAWKHGDRPQILDHLADDEPHRQALLIELVHTEFEYRLKLGEPARVEEYLRKYPSLGHPRKTVLDLILAELSFRRRREPELSRRQFIDRFPEFRDDLEPTSSDPLKPNLTTRPADVLVGPRALDPAELPLPRRFGKFELRRKIGSGAQGMVYQAWDTVLNREVAVKIPRPEIIEAHQNVRAFLREARNAIELQHPNIVAIHDAGPIEGVVCIVRAYVEGITLTDQIRDAPLEPEEAASVMVLVAEALEYAHGRGIIHRDLKPSNILLDLQGQPHISDFGLAKRTTGDSTLSMSGKQGVMIGTPAYMSPEQARGDSREVDPRSDVFSAGVVLYELLTGALPFRGRGKLLLAQIQGQEPTTPRSLNEEVTEDLQSICLKALAKRPEDRYPSAQAMADDLRRFLGGRTLLLKPERDPPKFRPSRTIRSPSQWVLGLLLSLLILSSFLWRKAEERRSRDFGLSEKSYRALLDLTRPSEVSAEGSVEKPGTLTRRIWSETERLAPLLEADPSHRGLAAEAQRRLAERASSRGSDRAARSHWDKAVDFAEQWARLDPDSLAAREIKAVGLANLAAIEDRSFEKVASRRLFDQSLEVWRELLEIRRRTFEARPDDTSLALDLVETALQVAERERSLGPIPNLVEVELTARDLTPRSTLGRAARARLAGVWLDLARLQLASRLPIRSQRSAEQAQKLYLEFPEGSISEVGLARSALAQARSNRELDRTSEAKKQYRLAIKRLEALSEAAPESPDPRRWLGQAQFEIGMLLDRTGPRPEALIAYRKSLTIRDRLARDEPSSYFYRLERAETRSALASEPEVGVIRSLWLGGLALGDRLDVLRLAPGLDENRRELQSGAATFLLKLFRKRTRPELFGGINTLMDSR